MSDAQNAIAAVCDEIKQLLLEKNAKYGNSALEPSRIFSRATAIEQLLVRIDDKLSRIRTSGQTGDEDTELDLIGYLVLLRVARRMHAPRPGHHQARAAQHAGAGMTQLPLPSSRLCAQCREPVHALGMCRVHYRIWQRHGVRVVLDKLREQVRAPATGCA